MLLDLAKYSSLLVLLGTHVSHLLEESGVCGGQCLQGSYKAVNSKAEMVMEGSDVVGATDGTNPHEGSDVVGAKWTRESGLQHQFLSESTRSNHPRNNKNDAQRPSQAPNQ